MQTRRLVLAMHDARPIWAIPDAAVERIRAALPEEWRLDVVDDPVDGHGDGSGLSPRLLDLMPGAEAYFGIGFPRALFLATESTSPGTLRWVHTGTAGVGSLLSPELRSSDVILTNSAGIHAPTIAETVLAMMLHFSRGLDFAVHAQQASRWDTMCFDQKTTRVTELQDATLGIVGYGGIGRELARRARALGMHCLATRRRAQPADGNDVEILLGPDGLVTLLERSDYLVIAAPSTPDTYHLIATPELARVRRTAVLINVSRGSIVDQRALINALREHRIRGAGLDVFASEPLATDSPLWQLPNVLVTPHVSAVSPLYWVREMDLILDNIARYLSGQPLRNVVDKVAGY